ncbi:GNAT family N-acetyltransferase [Brevibacillus humidisoli]|uniref:GNAT family N-acetyltransferase n=1 Tax=Brevibacillus humidisoli TaxID=2895522 RepID=UPI001E3F8450|nr:GNAT family protein [Brevibacillus humidisoli]UFJ39748.1 GNAT family N-acetyltransferase [Brevibacillus humidisoli]
MEEIALSANASLRRLELTDAAEVFAVIDANRTHLRQWLPWVDDTASVDDSAAFIKTTISGREQNQGLTFGIRLADKLVGTISVHGINWADRKTTLGYWLAADAQGMGLMTASVRAYLDHLVFGEWQLNRVQIAAAVENQKSRAIPERLGFRLEGIFRQNQLLYNRYVDHSMYAILAEEWLEIRGKNLN